MGKSGTVKGAALHNGLRYNGLLVMQICCYKSALVTNKGLDLQLRLSIPGHEGTQRPPQHTLRAAHHQRTHARGTKNVWSHHQRSMPWMNRVEHHVFITPQKRRRTEKNACSSPPGVVGHTKNPTFGHITNKIMSITPQNMHSTAHHQGLKATKPSTHAHHTTERMLTEQITCCSSPGGVCTSTAPSDTACSDPCGWGVHLYCTISHCMF